MRILDIFINFNVYDTVFLDKLKLLVWFES